MQISGREGFCYIRDSSGCCQLGPLRVSEAVWLGRLLAGSTDAAIAILGRRLLRACVDAEQMTVNSVMVLSTPAPVQGSDGADERPRVRIAGGEPMDAE